MALNEHMFNSCSLDEKMDIVRRHGEFVSKITYFGFYINLYVVDQVFIEVYYNLHSSVVQYVEILDSHEERLNLFTVKVDLSDLFSRK
ncbi:MAG: hypothetical protein K0S53_2325 [Bacteroidetes bacterium]|jgi:hypothetical protein|nr:hypothetical protein [Bacteroidota bacterium]MDF2450574.1 hypothetical protein [Bacteroidota bacterium]